ncbi:MAG: hypothetical protein QMD23_06240 [Candidatus Bathyarchaeia archaeon]|nr:hypothetical protein [Candidatus Bathyarchaeia archaeon]
MSLQINIKAASTPTIVLLMIISLIAGGVISYMFTIPLYTEIPEGTTLTITGVYFDKGKAATFKVGVLNPSYSPSDATITRIAVSLKGERQLYDIIETEPSMEIVIPKGKHLNITCSKARKDDFNVTWGRLAGEFAGKTIIVHVFSSDSPAANMEATVPFVKLHITDTDFDPKVSFKMFNVTIMNDADSVINLTINKIMVPGVELKGISPELPQAIVNGTSINFTFNGSWHGLIKTAITISTEEGYIFSKEFELQKVHTIIQNVLFNEDYTDHFNVTVFNFAESANHVNVTKIMCALENGTTIERNYPLEGIAPNSTWTCKFDWNWREYRGKEISVTAYLLQDFETDPFTGTTPSPIVVKILNEKEVFDLKDRVHFNVTLQNHQSSLDAVNVTKIVVKETGEVINGTKANPPLPSDPIEPSQAIPFYCNITDWTDRAGKNLTLTVHTVANETSEEHIFDFVFTLPAAELNITSDNTTICTVIGETRYLNITVQNLGHSIWNLTISKVRIELQNQTEQLEQTFPENQIIVKPGDTAVLLCLFDWEKHQGESIIITVITSEGVEASQTFQIPEFTT